VNRSRLPGPWSGNSKGSASPARITGRAWRAWNRGAEEAARANFGDRAFETVLKSPARIEADFGAKGKVFAKTYGFQPAGKPVIALDSDPREALKITTAGDRLRKMLEVSIDSTGETE